MVYLFHMKSFWERLKTIVSVMAVLGCLWLTPSTQIGKYPTGSVEFLWAGTNHLAPPAIKSSIRINHKTNSNNEIVFYVKNFRSHNRAGWSNGYDKIFFDLKVRIPECC